MKKNSNFTEHFVSNFKEGDLIYGCQNDRQRLALSPLFNRFIQENRKCPPLIIDTINDNLLGQPISQGFDKNSLHQNSKKHHDFIINYKDKQYVAERLTSEHKINRMCKSGIRCIIDEKNSSKIHFVLDGFEPIGAMNKQSVLAKSFVSKEFRAIYREWLKSPDKLDEKIIFYDFKNEKKYNSSIFFKKIDTVLKDKLNISLKNLYSPKSLVEKKESEHSKYKDIQNLLSKMSTKKSSSFGMKRTKRIDNLNM